MNIERVFSEKNINNTTINEKAAENQEYKNNENIFNLNVYNESKDINTLIAECFELENIINETAKNSELCSSSKTNGQIDDSRQGRIGDCWLLAGLNSLSYTEAGRQAIKDSLEYHDEYTIVHLNGVGDYVVKYSELLKAEWSDQYSKGDKDMMIFEIAMRKVLDDIINGKVKVDENAPGYIKDQEKLKQDCEGTEGERLSIEGGWEKELWYYLTGKTSTTADNKTEMNKYLDEFQKNGGKDIVLGTSNKDEAVMAQDINGQLFWFGAPHACSVKKVTDDNVTITNPANSATEIVLTREKFLEIFDTIEKCDLSNTKEESFTTIKTENGHGDTVEYADRDVVCYDNGNIQYIRYYDKDGNVKSIEKYNSKGKIEERTDYAENGKSALKTEYNKSGNVKSQTYCFETDYWGNEKQWLGETSDEIVENIYERGLLEYSGWSGEQIYNCATMTDKEWNDFKKNLV